MASAAASSPSVYLKLFNKRGCGSAIPGFSSIKTTCCFAGTVHGRSTLLLESTRCLPIRNSPSIFKCVHQTSEPSVSIDSLQSNDVSIERVVVLVIGGGAGNMRFAMPCDNLHHVRRSRDATCILDLDILDSSAVISFCHKRGVGLVVVGPEAPLVLGLADDLVKAGIPAFGPSSEAAVLEGSKNFMKNLCEKYNIPTAKYKTFMDPSAAKKYIKEEGIPIVIKADGLADGKGVIIAMTLEEAYEAVDSMLVKGIFGSAGCKIVVEEFLEGEEASFHALVDGENAVALESAQDHKQVGDGDIGPNTGGMGAYSPAPILTPALQSLVMKSIILPTVKGMAAEGHKFVVLYAGLMIEKKSGLPKLIEYNVRFGDPECQLILLSSCSVLLGLFMWSEWFGSVYIVSIELLMARLVQAMLADCRGDVTGVKLRWSPKSAMVVIMASKGYPGAYDKGSVIWNLEEVEVVAPSVKILHAGTAFDSDGNIITNGDLEEARERAYQAIQAINWPGGFYRRDIEWRALAKRRLANQG
ncbi:hypothetical protein BT93_K0857 [Corymbia citriodora subsp. variegata]|nr:hypothetical protein BT93_K0857 [Corymbia citriodora subsp. variegata]